MNGKRHTYRVGIDAGIACVLETKQQGNYAYTTHGFCCRKDAELVACLLRAATPELHPHVVREGGYNHNPGFQFQG
jgi:hypothetical protein